jgi:hypothetical protein
MLEFLWNSNVVGFVLGALATFFVVKNNLRRAEAAWDKADLLKAEATALKIKALEIFASVKGKI